MVISASAQYLYWHFLYSICIGICFLHLIFTAFLFVKLFTIFTDTLRISSVTNARPREEVLLLLCKRGNRQGKVAENDESQTELDRQVRSSGPYN